MDASCFFYSLFYFKIVDFKSKYRMPNVSYFEVSECSYLPIGRITVSVSGGSAH